MEHSKKLAAIAVKALEDKKGEEIRVLDIRAISSLADYFIIAGGKNKNQIQAMADEVEEKLGKAGIPVRHVEGYDEAGWVLMDYGDAVIHIFDQENREFYQLEKIWSDARIVDKGFGGE